MKQRKRLPSGSAGEIRSEDDQSLAALQKRIGYRFANIQLLEQALTHRSFGAQHNERLEYLGDAVLYMVISVMLYTALPHMPEGQLTRIRANLVRESALMELAKRMQLGDCLRLGMGERNCGGAKRPSILANVVEALVGAVLLDSDYATVEALVRVWLQDVQVSLDMPQSAKDAKTQLQEWMQSCKATLPQYTVLAITGALHAQVFDVQCTVWLPTLADQPVQERGSGLTRRAAEQTAADAVLARLKVLSGSATPRNARAQNSAQETAAHQVQTVHIADPAPRKTKLPHTERVLLSSVSTPARPSIHKTQAPKKLTPKPLMGKGSAQKVPARKVSTKKIVVNQAPASMGRARTGSTTA